MKVLIGISNGKAYQVLKQSKDDPDIGVVVMDGYTRPVWCTFEAIYEVELDL